MLQQRTLQRLTRTTGVGLHTGARVEMILRPAPPDTGIVFHRTDLPSAVAIPAVAANVGDTRLSSTLKADGASVSTVEHLMSALAGLGIDNLYVDVTAAEIPILDGSAGSFVFLVQSAGIVEQRAAKRFIRVRRRVEVRDGDKWARLDPHFGFKLRFSIAFAHPAIDATEQAVEVDFATMSYVKEVARARTFGFMQDVEAMRAAGLGLGGSLQNAVVLDALVRQLRFEPCDLLAQVGAVGTFGGHRASLSIGEKSWSEPRHQQNVVRGTPRRSFAKSMWQIGNSCSSRYLFWRRTPRTSVSSSG